MAETSHDARSRVFFTADGVDKGWYAEGVRAFYAVIIKYLRNKGLVFSASWEQWLKGVSHYVLSHSMLNAFLWQGKLRCGS